ncbi:MAG TPA: hypothetical protein VGK67_39280 [Myxococcales bacterium]|jgi:Na+-transporting NADH:ubiquinone oxidoreductase subunit NqrF
MFRSLALLVAAFALASCSGPVSKDDCTKAGEPGKWKVSFSLSSGDTVKCPALETKTIELPSKCEENCGCTESTVVFVPAQNSALQDTCSLRFQELCPAYELDCRYVDVTSATGAVGNCFYKVGALSCGYNVTWAKQP